jgi:hypothetical protein
MKTIRYIFSFAFFTLLLVGCSNFTNMNINPNQPDDSYAYDFNIPKLVTQFRAVSFMDGDKEQRIKSLGVDYWSQVIEDAGGWSTKNYVPNDSWNSGWYWTPQMSWISTLNTVISLGINKPDRVNSVAVARIWRVYTQSRACDYFGPMPFPSWQNPVDNPPYVSVQDQYTEFFSELDAAVKMIDPSKPFMSKYEDLIFGGNVMEWVKFANSLRLRLALRVSEVDPTLCKTQAQAAINGGVMDSPSDDARIPVAANGWGQYYNYTMFFISWGDIPNMTSSMEKLMTNLGGIPWPADVAAVSHPAYVDPRGPVMYDPGTQGWKGMPPGIAANQSNTGTYAGSYYSQLGKFILGVAGALNDHRPYDVMLYDEVCFLKAEAAARGFVTGVNAQTEYENGIRACMQRYNIPNDVVTNYLTSTSKNLAGTSVSYMDANGQGNTVLEKIITQKYIACIPDVSWEGWNDKRRLNLPRFDPLQYRDPAVYQGLPNVFNDPRSFVKRMPYPSSEAMVNKTEYAKGVQILSAESGNSGTDVSSTKLWWDKNANYCTSAN